MRPSDYQLIVSKLLLKLRSNKREKEREKERARQIAEVTAEAEADVDDESDEGAMRRSDLVSWYVESIMDSLQTEEEVAYQYKLAKLIVKRMVEQVFADISFRDRIANFYFRSTF